MSDRDQYEAAVAVLDARAELVDARELTGGVSAHVVLLRYRTGDDVERKAVFRQHRSDLVKRKGPGLAGTEHATTKLLHGVGLAVPEPLAHVDGSGGWPPYLVTEYVEGSTSVGADDLDDSLDAMAGFLARLHGVDPGPLTPTLPSLEDPVEALPAYLAGDRRARAIEEAIAARTSAHRRRVIVHGDFWPGNVLWAGGGLAAVIDWEDAGLGDPLADLATARVELLCEYGPAAVERFTSSYLRAMPHDAVAELLPIWELYVSAAALASMDRWGLAPAEEAARRTTTRAFFDRAADDLLAMA